VNPEPFTAKPYPDKHTTHPIESQTEHPGIADAEQGKQVLPTKEEFESHSRHTVDDEHLTQFSRLILQNSQVAATK